LVELAAAVRAQHLDGAFVEGDGVVAGGGFRAPSRMV
jgi:hypothetical protein